GYPLEKLAPSRPDREVVIEGGAPVLIMAEIPDAGINRLILLGDLPRPIARCIVRDDQLEVGVGLCQQSIQRLCKETLAVVDGQAEREARRRDTHFAPSGTAW